MAAHGIKFGQPRIDAMALRGWKNEVVGKLTGGLSQLAKQRKVRVVRGTAKFESANTLRLDNDETVGFAKCIIAAGSEPAMLPDLPDDVRIILFAVRTTRIILFFRCTFPYNAVLAMGSKHAAAETAVAKKAIHPIRRRNPIQCLRSG